MKIEFMDGAFSNEITRVQRGYKNMLLLTSPATTTNRYLDCDNVPNCGDCKLNTLKSDNCLNVLDMVNQDVLTLEEDKAMRKLIVESDITLTFEERLILNKGHIDETKTK